MRIKLAYCSGTGGTRRIALCLADEFSRQGHEVDTQRIQFSDCRSTSLDSYDLLVIASVVHDFNIPHQMMLWIEKLELTPGLATAVITVSAGGAAITNRAVRHYAKELLEAKGAVVFFEDMFPMPCNYYYHVKHPVDAMEMEAYPLIARKRAGQILAGERRRFREPLVDRLITRSCKNAWQRDAAFGQSITVSATCTGCGLCVEDCPSGNIRLEPIEGCVSQAAESDGSQATHLTEGSGSQRGTQGRPVFSDRCSLCMSCLYICPQLALRPGREKYAVLKGGFDLDEIAQRRATDDDWRSLESLTRGWLYSGISSYLIEARKLRNQMATDVSTVV